MVPPEAIDRRGGDDVVPVLSLLPADSPRLSGEDKEHVRRLAEMDAALPPILVHRQTMRIVDGMHRLRAAILNRRHSVEVEYFDGSEDDAFLRSVEINTTHGLPLTMAERKAAAARILITHHHLSNRAVADRTGLSDKTVAAIRRSTAEIPQSNNRLGKDGRVRPLDARMGRRRVREIIAMRPDASLREIAKAAGVSVSTAKDVRDALQRQGDPATAHGGRPAVPATPPAQEVSPTRPAAEHTVHSAIDVAKALERLKRDPALRYSDSGRDLLRMLQLHTAFMGIWPSLADTVPAHCADLIAKLAQRYSYEWHSIGKDLEKRCLPSGGLMETPAT